jgi:hypothetical protein
MWWLNGILQKIPIKCARVGRKNRDGTVGEPWKDIYFFSGLIHTHMTQVHVGWVKENCYQNIYNNWCLYKCWIVKVYRCFGGIHINCYEYENIVDRLPSSGKHHRRRWMLNKNCHFITSSHNFTAGETCRAVNWEPLGQFTSSFVLLLELIVFTDFSKAVGEI